ncbi:hypothetical protein EDEG_01880 [Edhazardia aedis USNM 41457]|uniref:Uncharacterized protein n=1 Tax=Edhazardia aedis (strain USNM 41457) TaxID=1003232 RepID=J9DR52_EDHAE|nr:hypothetical protein EDEG_01880 [Edhazardia aedis USNM 41457]|eukprot:EJW03822.1 hypothetical protein EDEG_01880 [Edhazardia aedis USNM 41457]
MNENPFENKISTILSKGKCPKIVLFDSETTLIFSNLISYSRFVANEFFCFELITNKNRQKMSELTCFVFLRPENYLLMVDEVKNPFYTEYILLFTNTIDNEKLEEIAINDMNTVVKEVHEVYIDVVKQDNHLFTCNYLNKPFDYSALMNFNRTVSGIFSFLRTVNFDPLILYQTKSQVAKNISNELNLQLEPLKLKKTGCLVILDRKFDILTPLLYGWTFQQMIDEIISINNGIVKISKKDFDLSSNVTYNKIKFYDINRAAQEIKDFVAKIDQCKNNSKDLFEDIEEKSKNTDCAECLILIQNKLLEVCFNYKEISELELNLVQKKRQE